MNFGTGAIQKSGYVMRITKDTLRTSRSNMGVSEDRATCFTQISMDQLR